MLPRTVMAMAVAEICGDGGYDGCDGDDDVGDDSDDGYVGDDDSDDDGDDDDDGYNGDDDDVGDDGSH